MSVRACPPLLRLPQRLREQSVPLGLPFGRDIPPSLDLFLGAGGPVAEVVGVAPEEAEDEAADVDTLGEGGDACREAPRQRCGALMGYDASSMTAISALVSPYNSYTASSISRSIRAASRSMSSRWLS